MSRNVFPLVWTVFFSLVVSPFRPPACLASGADAPAGNAGDDCGTTALYTILAIEGRSVPVSSIRRSLPALDPNGHSMAELRDAARALGLGLTGVQFRQGDVAPDRPALIFLERDGHGHFAVIRPVGHSGKLVQIIDPAEDPFVMDAAALYALPQWTGLALVPSRPSWILRIAVGFSLVAASGALVIWARREHRRRRPAGGRQLGGHTPEYSMLPTGV